MAEFSKLRESGDVDANAVYSTVCGTEKILGDLTTAIHECKKAIAGGDETELKKLIVDFLDFYNKTVVAILNYPQDRQSFNNCTLSPSSRTKAIEIKTQISKP